MNEENSVKIFSTTFRCLRMSLLLIVSTGLFACQTAPSVTPGVGFSVAQADSVGVRGIYQEVDKTFLLFAHFVPSATKIYGSDGERLPAARSGRLIGVSGQHERIGVRLGGAMAVAKRVSNVAEVTMPSEVWHHRRSIIAQLEQLGDTSNVDSRLKSTSDRTLSLLKPAADKETSAMAADQNQQVIQFDGDSLSPKSEATIIETVRRAQESSGVVTIHVVVPPGATIHQLVMAKERAKVVRSRIVDQGVEAERAVIAPAHRLSDGDNRDTSVTVSFGQKTP